MAEAKALLGSFNLNDATTDRKPPAGASYGFAVLAGDFDPGSPQAVTKAAGDFLLDGDWEQVDKFGNRQRVMQVEVYGTSGDALDDAERALQLALDSAQSLTFTLPNRTEDTVFDVLYGVMAEVFDDLADVMRTSRIYRLTIACQPWARRESLLTVTFTPGAGSPVTLATGNTPANWVPVSGSGSPSPTTANIGGDDVIRITTSAASGTQVTFGYNWTGTVGSGATYLAITMRTDVVSAPQDTQIVLGSSFDAGATPVAVQGQTRYFVNPGGTPRFWFRGTKMGSANNAFQVTTLAKSTALPAGAFSVLEIPGSRRTSGSVRITNPAGSPAPTPAGVAVYADQTMLTYGWQPDVATSWAQAPAGTYMAFIPTSGASAGDKVTLTFTPTGGTAQAMSTIYDATALNGAIGLPIGPFDLGGTRDGVVGAGTWSAVRGVSSTVISLTNNLRLIRMSSLRALRSTEDAAALVTLNVSVGAGEILIDAKSADEPRGGAWISSSGVTRDASEYVTAWNHLVLQPPLTAIWTYPTDLSIDATFYARYLNYVAPNG